MCKHILNAQVSVRSPCCRRWFDCADCHKEQESHALLQSMEMTLACKKCKKCFRKDAAEFEESDEYCPHCDNHFVLDALTPKPVVNLEGEDPRKDARMLKDERLKPEEERSIFDVKDAPNRLG
ncbi:zinc finger protein [Arthroderma uncinatum]|uniref:zinc finger protein n=1 Tax=Arthroderma uncinatum TaxID=74035 RepID=UPI00144A752B|nr:zinc finger protein [Arthroderma uncinatum]KAF3479654.1 zinc finger protein [Arthroderma uncinatum]